MVIDCSKTDQSEKIVAVAGKLEALEAEKAAFDEAKKDVLLLDAVGVPVDKVTLAKRTIAISVVKGSYENELQQLAAKQEEFENRAQIVDFTPEEKERALHLAAIAEEEALKPKPLTVEERLAAIEASLKK